MYYFTTTICAVILGIILVSVIRPGDDGNSDQQLGGKISRDVLTADTLLDLVRFVNFSCQNHENLIGDYLKISLSSTTEICFPQTLFKRQCFNIAPTWNLQRMLQVMLKTSQTSRTRVEYSIKLDTYDSLLIL